MTSATPMRVVLLAGRLDREATGWYAADLSRALREQGHEVFLIVREMPAGPSGETPARWCRDLSAWASGASTRQFLVGELEAFGATVVHAAEPRLGLAAREIAKRLGLPSAVTVHGAGRPRGWRAVDLEGHGLIVPGEALADDLAARLGIPRERIAVVPPGVRVPPGKLPEPPPSGRTPVVGAVGPLEYAEGQRFLLDAARRLLDEGLELQVLIAGSGPEKASLKRQAAELKLDDVVTFAEDISRLREVIEVMDVFVVPAARGALSLTMLEAMAAGKPVVCAAAQGAGRVAEDGRTALVVPQADAEALAEAIERLLLKPDVAAQLAREARELVRRDFSLDAMARRTADAYRALREVPR